MHQSYVGREEPLAILMGMHIRNACAAQFNQSAASIATYRNFIIHVNPACLSGVRACWKGGGLLSWALALLVLLQSWRFCWLSVGVHRTSCVPSKVAFPVPHCRILCVDQSTLARMVFLLACITKKTLFVSIAPAFC